LDFWGYLASLLQGKIHFDRLIDGQVLKAENQYDKMGSLKN
jgi:hypothetical protein